jgi:hypothetical protein
LTGRSFGNDLTFFHKTNAMTTSRFIHIGGGDDDGYAVTLNRNQLDQQLPEILTCDWINACGGLVEQKDFRSCDQR